MKLSNIKSRDFYRLLDELSTQAKTYIVGGFVRDYMLGNPSHDLDVVVGMPIEHILLFLDKRAYIDNMTQVGVAFGVVKVTLMDGTKVDIAQFRAETYTEGNRKPTGITFVKTIEEDLQRRDFTINAMALLYIGNGEFLLIDPFGGLKDLQARIIRAVGEPSARFTEDPLRIQRGIRFSVRLGFTIEQKTFESMVELSPLLAA